MKEADEIEGDQLLVTTALSNSLLLFPQVRPSSFTPNGDGINEGFNIVYTGQLEGEIKIFNRLGNMVHQGQINNPFPSCLR